MFVSIDRRWQDTNFWALDVREIYPCFLHVILLPFGKYVYQLFLILLRNDEISKILRQFL